MVCTLPHIQQLTVTSVVYTTTHTTINSLTSVVYTITHTTINSLTSGVYTTTHTIINSLTSVHYHTYQQLTVWPVLCTLPHIQQQLTNASEPEVSLQAVEHCCVKIYTPHVIYWPLPSINNSQYYPSLPSTHNSHYYKPHQLHLGFCECYYMTYMGSRGLRLSRNQVCPLKCA